MATRLYIQNVAAEFTPTNKRGAWDQTASSVVKKMGVNKSGVAATIGIAETNIAANWDVLLATFISQPLNVDTNFTTSDTVQWVIGALESNLLADFFYHVHIYATVGDSDTVRGTLLTDSTGATELPTTAAGAGEGTKSLSNNVSALAGDRIVAEIGYVSQNTVTTSYTGTINYGATGSVDLIGGSTSVTTNPGWIEFSNTFLTAPSFVDDFSDNSISALWVKEGIAASVNEQNQRVEITHAATIEYNMLRTLNPYQLDEVRCSVQIVDVGNQALSSHEAIFLAESATDGSNKIFVTISGNFVSAFKTVASVQTQVGSSIAYDANVHKYWSFRETGGTLFWEYSADGSIWVNPSGWSLGIGFNTTAFYFGLQSGTYANQASGSFTYFDNFNISFTPRMGFTMFIDPGVV